MSKSKLLPSPGAVFAGDYKVIRTLGRGSMGVVFLVDQLSVPRRCALKVLHPQVFEQDAKARERHERETRASSQIVSDAIVKVFTSGLDEASGLAWIAMEYVEGKTLDAFLEAHADASRETRDHIVDQIFGAVAAAHAAGIVHRDIKPENILVLDDDGPADRPRIKVMDFGVAKRLGLSPNNSTAEGLGTPIWTAPEQSNRTKGLNASADVWALGLVTFFVYTGKIYWKNANNDASVIDLLIEIGRDRVDPPTERAAMLGAAGKLPDGFDRWFARCVHREPSARWPDAKRAHDALRGRAEPEQAAPPSSELGAASLALQRKRHLAQFAVLIALSLALSVAVWALLRRP